MKSTTVVLISRCVRCRILLAVETPVHIFSLVELRLSLGIFQKAMVAFLHTLQNFIGVYTENLAENE